MSDFSQLVTLILVFRVSCGRLFRVLAAGFAATTPLPPVVHLFIPPSQWGIISEL
jgi:hypothetical protein